jgi:protein-S-isoprenylcysteine O-methyltransferase Ste14
MPEPTPSHAPPLPLPPSATPGSLAIAGLASLLLASWALFGMQLLGPLHTPQAAGWATAVLLAAVGGGMSLFDLLWLRSWRRHLAVVHRQAPQARAARVLRKWLGLHATLAAVAAVYWVLAEYRSSLYAPFFTVAGTLLPVFSLLAVPYIAWVDARMASPQDVYWQLGDALLGGRHPIDRTALGQHTLAWAVKGFFLPLMFGYATRNVVSLATGQGLLQGTPDFTRVFDWAFTTLYFIDVVWGAVGYLWSLRLTDSHVRSTEPSALGWVVAMMCYEPISRGLWPAWFAYDAGRPWGHWLAASPLLYQAWGTLILLLTAVYAWATVSFGLRFSNLTHRGIITNGPYRWVRHPAYLAKNLSWWLISMPFMVAGNPAHNLRLCAMLLLVNGLYALRARTEERHLLQDPVYQAYARAVAARQQALRQRLLRWARHGRVPLLPAATAALRHAGPG